MNFLTMVWNHAPRYLAALEICRLFVRKVAESARPCSVSDSHRAARVGPAQSVRRRGRPFQQAPK